ncbi:MAG: tetratricopeptide repeat protein [Bacteroidales bacterium]|nr:tetratricopeptide repeat protein [Bacteroidales bacterium]
MRHEKIHLKLVLTIVFVWCSVTLFCQANETFDSLSKALIQSNTEKDKIGILLALSAEVEGKHPEDAVNYAKNAHEIAVNLDMPKETILTLIQLSNSYLRSSRYQEATECAENALDMATDLHLKNEIARAREKLSVIFFELGDFDKSAKFDFENLKYYEHINDQKQIGVTLGNIGIDFISQNNYQKGLEFLKKSLDIALKNGDSNGIAFQYNNIASVYFEQYNDYKIALSYFREALKINDNHTEKQQQGIYLMNIGVCLAKLNQTDSILAYYQNATGIFRNLKQNDLYAECQSLLSDYYLKKGETAKSIAYADTAFQISKKYNYKENLRKSAGLLHKIYLSKKDTTRAYHYAMIENEVKDSLFILRNQKDVYRLEFQYNFEKYDKLKQISRQKKDNLMVVIILSLVSGLIIIILMFSRHRIKARNLALEKQSIEKELQFKDKELTINLISLIKKNELLSDISNKLYEIGQSAKKDETVEAINRIHRELRHSADDKMLKEFSVRFQEIHSGFYETLLKNHPDLTQNELKLCAFLRLNMSSKEISDLTGQRILTIDHARYRLRKKLGISNSEVNLVTFLSQI